MRIWCAGFLVGSVALVGCGPPPGQSATTTTQPVVTTTSPPATTVPLVPGCEEEGRFVEGGRVARIHQPTSDSGTLGLISWQAEEACETFTFAFETSEGAPATTPPSVIVDYLPTFQILRIRLDVESTFVTDQLVETKLVDRLYVVRGLNGGMFVDLHLAAPTQARATVDTSPALLTLDLQPGLVPLEGVAAFSDRVVLATPTPGARVGTLVELLGYSRTFEANVLVIATVGEEVVAQESTTTAGYVETWGEFRTTVEVPAGELSLFVGEQSPLDGTLQGVTLSLSAG